MLFSIKKKLEKHRKEGRYRKIQPASPELINLSSNDYLGLSQNDRLKGASIQACTTYGTSSASSRLMTGTLPLHTELETLLKNLLNKEILLFNTGYQANQSILATLAQDKNTLFLIDHQAHRSLLEGATTAKKFRFRHNDCDHLKKLLEKHRSSYESCWIITESLFGMDGDTAPLEEIYQLKKQFNCFFYVDEAHAFGVLGDQGLGLANEFSDITLATFGKALGSFGAFIATSPILKEYLINFCPGLTYTTSLPPAVLGANIAAVSLIPSLEKERNHLKTLRDILLKKTDFKGEHHILQYITDNPKRLSEYFKSQGFLLWPIMPPTYHRPMLRLSLSCHLSEEQLHHFLKVDNELSAKTDT